MAPRKKRRFPQVLSEVVRGIYPAPDQLHEVQLFAWWNRSVPPRIASRARPVRLERGTLLVHVESAAWAQELSYQAEDLLRRIQAFMPRAGVRELRFRVGPLPEVPLRAEARRKTPEPLPVVAMPEELGRALAHVHDDEVRAAVARAASISLRQEAAEAELNAEAKRRGRE